MMHDDNLLANFNQITVGDFVALSHIRNVFYIFFNFLYFETYIFRMGKLAGFHLMEFWETIVTHVLVRKLRKSLKIVCGKSTFKVSTVHSVSIKKL